MAISLSYSAYSYYSKTTSRSRFFIVFDKPEVTGHDRKSQPEIENIFIEFSVLELLGKHLEVTSLNVLEKTGSTSGYDRKLKIRPKKSPYVNW